MVQEKKSVQLFYLLICKYCLKQLFKIGEGGECGIIIGKWSWGRISWDQNSTFSGGPIFHHICAKNQSAKNAILHQAKEKPNHFLRIKILNYKLACFWSFEDKAQKGVGELLLLISMTWLIQMPKWLFRLFGWPDCHHPE